METFFLEIGKNIASSVIVQIIVKSSRKLYVFIKGIFKKENPKISFIPRKKNLGLWGPCEVWLEIVGYLETNKCIAILRKLEEENDGVSSNYLERVTNSIAPRLKISGQKVFVAETESTNVVIVLEDGKSNPLPKGNKFYIEIDLLKDTKLVKKFKGYLVDGYPDIEIKEQITNL